MPQWFSLSAFAKILSTVWQGVLTVGAYIAGKRAQENAQLELDLKTGQDVGKIVVKEMGKSNKQVADEILKGGEI